MSTPLISVSTSQMCDVLSSRDQSLSDKTVRESIAPSSTQTLKTQLLPCESAQNAASREQFLHSTNVSSVLHTNEPRTLNDRGNDGDAHLSYARSDRNDTYKSERDQWEAQMIRLINRVNELEEENGRLRHGILSKSDGEVENFKRKSTDRRHSVVALEDIKEDLASCIEVEGDTDLPGLDLVDRMSESDVKVTQKTPPNGIIKSKSFADGFGYNGRSVVEAAAASHRSRARQATRESLNKYRAGYWNRANNIKSSFSCNNLEDFASANCMVNSEPLPVKHLTNLVRKRAQKAGETRNYRFSSTSIDKSASSQDRVHPKKLYRTDSRAGITSAIPTLLNQNEDQQNVSQRSTEESKTDLEDEPYKFDRYSSDFTRSGIKFWVGTWNLGASDPFLDDFGPSCAAKYDRILQNYIPRKYQLYVIGVQESISENIYRAIEAYLNRNGENNEYARLDLKNCDFMVRSRSHTADATIDAVRGRGDGAFVGSKFTGIAIFYATEIRKKLKLVRSGVHKFNLTSGSKGGVAAALLLNGTTTLAFVNCHLDARNDVYRREQIRTLNAILGRIMGHASFDLTAQFHHVVWMGDLNYRIILPDPHKVLRMLSEGRIKELYDKYDGLLNDRRKGGVFEGFKEPHIVPNFYPTYKKFPNRGYVDDTLPSWPARVYRTFYKEPFYKGGKVKTRVPGWCDRILSHSLHACDSTLAVEKVLFDKHGKIDNYSSVNCGEGMDISDHSPVYATFLLTFRQRRKLTRKHSASCAEITSAHLMRPRNSDTLFSTTGIKRSFRTGGRRRPNIGESYFDQAHIVQRMNSVLHARVVSTVLHIYNLHLVYQTHEVVPKRTRLVAPLMGEDPCTLKQCDILGERRQGPRGWNMSLNAVVQHSRPLCQLHMLMWFKHENINGYCTLSLERIPREEEGGEVKCKVPLHSNSMRLYNNGHPVLVTFSIRSKTFAK